MPLPLSPDYDAAGLRAAARASKDANQTRRLLTLAAIYDGATRTEAAVIGGVTVQIVRDWVVKLNAHGPAGLNPVENVWQFLRGNWLSNRVFASYTAIVDHCYDAWNRLAEQPWRVMSIGYATGPQVRPSESWYYTRLEDF